MTDQLYKVECMFGSSRSETRYVETSTGTVVCESRVIHADERGNTATSEWQPLSTIANLFDTEARAVLGLGPLPPFYQIKPWWTFTKWWPQ